MTLFLVGLEVHSFIIMKVGAWMDGGQLRGSRGGLSFFLPRVTVY